MARVDKETKQIAGGAFLGGFTGISFDLLVDRALRAYADNPQIIDVFYLNDLLTCLVYGGVGLYGIYKKNKMLTAFGLAGLGMELGQELMEKLAPVIPFTKARVPSSPATFMGGTPTGSKDGFRAIPTVEEPELETNHLLV